MLTALILICATGAPDCTRETAALVMRVPEQSALPFLCLRNGQAYLADLSIADVYAEDRIRIVCVQASKLTRD